MGRGMTPDEMRNAARWLQLSTLGRTVDACKEILRLAAALRAEADEKERGAHASTAVAVIYEYVEDYVFEGDDGAYTPSEDEKAMLLDFAHGLLARLTEPEADEKERAKQARGEWAG